MGVAQMCYRYYVVMRKNLFDTLEKSEKLLIGDEAKEKFKQSVSEIMRNIWLTTDFLEYKFKSDV